MCAKWISHEEIGLVFVCVGVGVGIVEKMFKEDSLESQTDRWGKIFNL